MSELVSCLLCGKLDLCECPVRVTKKEDLHRIKRDNNSKVLRAINRELRDKNISIVKFASKLDRSYHSTFGLLNRGRNTREKTLKELAKGLDTTYSKLLLGELAREKDTNENPPEESVLKNPSYIKFHDMLILSGDSHSSKQLYSVLKNMSASSRTKFTLWIEKVKKQSLK